MIPIEAIRAFFPDVHMCADELYKFTLKVPSTTTTYYLKCGCHNEPDFLLAVEGQEDDVFARNLFEHLFMKSPRVDKPTKLPLGFFNPYAFEMGLLVGPEYHGHFKGTLDDWRSRTFLCVPAYDCEFSGQEAPDEFMYIWVYLMPHTLRRQIVPKVKLRFDNPTTKANTQGRFLIRSEQSLNNTIESLTPEDAGYVLVLNYLEEQLTITLPEPNQYKVEWNKTSRLVDSVAIMDIVARFLRKGLTALSPHLPS
jgi:hypothetical protein